MAEEIGGLGKVNRGPGPCEEASQFSGAFYMPCGLPATKSMFSERDGRTYRMCDSCADHNSRRGMVEIQREAA